MIIDPHVIEDLDLELQDTVRDLRIYGVPGSNVEGVWKFVHPVLQQHPELWNRYNTEETLKSAFIDGSAKLWFVMDGDLIVMMFGTQVYNYPTCRALSVFWGTGRGMDVWLRLVLSALENFAARAELSYVFVDGRLPWKLPLKKFGYEMSSVRFVKPIHSKHAVN